MEETLIYVLGFILTLIFVLAYFIIYADWYKENWFDKVMDFLVKIYNFFKWVVK
jgi:hypothetical protein